MTRYLIWSNLRLYFDSWLKVQLLVGKTWQQELEAACSHRGLGSKDRTGAYEPQAPPHASLLLVRPTPIGSSTLQNSLTRWGPSVQTLFDQPVTTAKNKIWGQESSLLEWVPILMKSTSLSSLILHLTCFLFLNPAPGVFHTPVAPSFSALCWIHRINYVFVDLVQ